jgi:hypothetical protein
MGGNSFIMSAPYISGSGSQPCLRNGNDSASVSNVVLVMMVMIALVLIMKVMINI